jgi:hypothetical protein
MSCPADKETGGGTIASIATTCSVVGSQRPAAALALTCSGEVAPAMTEEQPGWAARPPIAISSRDAPCCLPQSTSASTVSSLASVT